MGVMTNFLVCFFGDGDVDEPRVPCGKDRKDMQEIAFSDIPRLDDSRVVSGDRPGVRGT